MQVSDLPDRKLLLEQANPEFSIKQTIIFCKKLSIRFTENVTLSSNEQTLKPWYFPTENES